MGVLLKQLWLIISFFLRADQKRRAEILAFFLGNFSLSIGKDVHEKNGDGSASVFEFERIMVNLSECQINAKGLDVVEHSWDGRIALEKRGNDIYAAGRRILLGKPACFDKNRAVVRGADIQEEFSANGKILPNASIMEALYENAEFIPKEWERSGFLVVFLGTVFKSPSRDLYVAALRFKEGKWRIGYGRMKDGWNSMTRVATFD